MLTALTLRAIKMSQQLNTIAKTITNEINNTTQWLTHTAFSILNVH